MSHSTSKFTNYMKSYTLMHLKYFQCRYRTFKLYFWAQII